ncbi:MAG: purine-nucleoside phosphorylase [Candidatus Lindowbacteria bacterium RIFCSPLOWO2_12_FULL_62_27]|nr:MAG: purine-nucleoside phosphorylase [Candidatus Lindowbacteria bacterium RIFCSPLOWO2_12_FULL_62_27]OGH58276.1 MAG: purine-nucleoside phosphorylase [Candidatus Lindowbacteria bacterium RIFCSPLOWO2_02_FULL_62_12]
MSGAADLQTALRAVRRRVSLTPRVAIVLGSGLGGLADRLAGREAIRYEDIPEFPRTNVPGHAGNLVFGALHGVPVVAMQGRVHYYEGHPMDKIVFGVRLMKLLGASILFTANAVGGINKKFRVGDLMLIRDHLNLLGDHPLRGPNPDSLGPRFYDMTCAYDADLRAAARRVARRMKLRIQEGVYAACLGPSYETPSEVRMLRKLGADAVGMSTVPEILAGRHMNMRCLSISLVSNLAAGVSKQALSHAEVIETSERVAGQFQRLVMEMMKEPEFK